MTIGGMGSSTCGRTGRSLAVAAAFTLVLAACSPVEGGPPDLAGVEEHLDLVVRYLPNGCEPVGLGGDGRGKMVEAWMECPNNAMFRIERFDSESNLDDLPRVPSVTRPGWVEWRDPSTGCVVRIISDELDVDVLMRIAESIEFRDQ